MHEIKNFKCKRGYNIYNAIIYITWASQVVQWLRICLPMQETWV